MSRRTRNIFIALAVVGILAYVGFLVYRHFFTFYMTGTSPRMSSVTVVTPYVDVNFNRTVVPYDEFLITGDNPEILKEIEFREKSIRIYFENFRLDSDYNLRFSPVRSDDGEELRNIELEFRARFGDFENLPDEQQRYILEEQDRQSETLTDPILQHLPHSTLTFELSPLVTQNDEGENILVLEAQILLSAADARIDAAAAEAQYKQEVLDYIRSLDLNPDDYTIEYEVIQPTI